MSKGFARCNINGEIHVDMHLCSLVSHNTSPPNASEWEHGPLDSDLLEIGFKEYSTGLKVAALKARIAEEVDHMICRRGWEARRVGVHAQQHLRKGKAVRPPPPAEGLGPVIGRSEGKLVQSVRAGRLV
eukprot:1646293-Pleurochrysis_carterae.AAC.1